MCFQDSSICCLKDKVCIIHSITGISKGESSSSPEIPSIAWQGPKIPVDLTWTFGSAIDDLFAPIEFSLEARRPPCGQKAIQAPKSVYAHWVLEDRIITTNLSGLLNFQSLPPMPSWLERISSVNAMSTFCEATLEQMLREGYPNGLLEVDNYRKKVVKINDYRDRFEDANMFVQNKVFKQTILARGLTKHPRANTRTSCMARILFKVQQNGNWDVINFVEEHNHPPGK
ncbi:hypothetical protein IFM89_036895 [Coptis chinensis]|uniref:FAR1 domain-containing protein n=1 Tax=Coptis chinensis TaxID=261450 RepID=A0A835I029_9MAGN|nr:hypothetical protein IFM89_036895 [Coptis chinensis]